MVAIWFVLVIRRYKSCTEDIIMQQNTHWSPSSSRCCPINRTVSFWCGGMKTWPDWDTPFEECPFWFASLLFKLFATRSSFSISFEPFVSTFGQSALPLECMSLEIRSRLAGGGGEPSSPVWLWESRPKESQSRGFPCKPEVVCWDLEDPRKQKQTHATRRDPS